MLTGYAITTSFCGNQGIVSEKKSVWGQKRNTAEEAKRNGESEMKELEKTILTLFSFCMPGSTRNDIISGWSPT
jgi:cytochrome b